MELFCKLGLHEWIYTVSGKDYKSAEKRICKKCGQEQTLLYSMSGIDNWKRTK